MKHEFNLELSCGLEHQMAAILAASVDQRIDTYWSDKIANEGIVPAEIVENPAALKAFSEKVKSFAMFVGQTAEKVFITYPASGSVKKPSSVHFIGVGTGEDLEHVVYSANLWGMSVRAYDVSTVAVEKARWVFSRLESALAKFPLVEGSASQTGSLIQNTAFHGDIEAVCSEEVIDPESARYLFLVRTLETLNKPSGDKEKLARVCKRIGPLLRYLKIIVIGARPEDNLTVNFRNTEPVTLVHLVDMMQANCAGKVTTEDLGKFQLYEHVYSASLVTGSGR